MPPARELREDGHGGNREYVDYRHLRWADVIECEYIERRLVEVVVFGKELSSRARLLLTMNHVDHSALDDDAAEHALYDMQLDLSDAETLAYRIDVGCATAVGALAAAKCPPISSCNGAIYGGHHPGTLTYVAFHANPTRLDLLNGAAILAGVNLEVGSEGCPIIYAESGRHGLLKFGQAMIELHRKTPLNRVMREARVRGDHDAEQLLFESFITSDA